MRDEDKWKCPWCGQVATRLRGGICDSRQCRCGAVGIGAPEGDWDEVTDEAIGLFGVGIDPASRGNDMRLRDDIKRSGVEVRSGVRDPDMHHPWGWAYQYTWFRRKQDPGG